MLIEIDFVPYKQWGLNATIKYGGKQSQMLKYANHTQFLYYSSYYSFFSLLFSINISNFAKQINYGTDFGNRLW